MTELDALKQTVDAELRDVLEDCDESLLGSMVQVCGLSDYVRQQVLRDPAMVQQLINSGDLDRVLPRDAYQQQLLNLTPATLDAALRHCRQRAMVRIVFRDLTRRATLQETTRDLSDLADACIDAALSVHYAKNCQKFGYPTGAESGRVQQMAVLALGKLGARELNVSSDIDLIFFYDESGTVVPSPDGNTAASDTRSNAAPLSNQEFFVRTSRDLIRSLDAPLVNGFVFRVDMRLRPYGESGGLILNSTAMEKYFYEQGRDWERYAFVKARPAAGDLALGESFLTWLKPFVYRKYLDFSAVDALREMKRLINSEVSRKEMQNDVKLGPGGIREIEFIVQALQLIWGGRESQLQERQILKAMTLLAEGDLMPAAEIEQLRAAYHFLRNSEHVIQAEKDRQTQALPTSSLSQQRLAAAMGFPDYDKYLAALNDLRQTVTDIFSRFMSSNNAEQEELVEGNMFWVSIWRSPLAPANVELLERSGFADAALVAAALDAFSQRLDERQIQILGRERLDRLIPVLLSLAAKEARPTITLQRVLPIVEQIVRRSTYIVYLLENLDALKRMVHLCGMSPWIAERLAELPILLYELSDRETHEAVFDKVQLATELRTQLTAAGDGDLEAQMDLLRQFKNAAVLKVAVFELLDILPLMKASDALTAIAEVVLDEAITLAWQELCQRFGEPCDPQGKPLGCCFGIVAYGKLGGIELGYGSDLDLVMLHDADLQGRSNGQRSLENGVFFHRLAQRIIHILTRYTRFGAVYEVDLRLRPSGNKGPLVSTFSAYERYLRESAWTWELQALVRSRWVAGEPGLAPKFDALREAILCQPRDRQALLQAVLAMREKMRQHLVGSAGRAQASAEDGADSADVLLSGFDLKHGAGAMVDIEFMVQFAVLATSHAQPEIARWSDKVRLLEALAAIGFFTEAERQQLHDAYLAYRSAVHYQCLGGEVSSFERLNEYRDTVVSIWQRCMTA